jgi:hypothetical protein
MSTEFLQVRVFPETEDFHPAVIYWSDNTLRLVHLLPDGPAESQAVEGVSRAHAQTLLSSSYLAEDPIDIVLAAQRGAADAG